MRKILLPALLSLVSLTAFSQATIVKYLSGTDKDHTVQWDFYCTEGQNSSKWTKIAVPSNWEQQGFGSYNYGMDKVKSNEQGLYKYKFTTDAAFKNKRVFIVFDGSMSDTEVKINGKPVGDVHQGSFYRFKYDITDLLLPAGDNLLEVTVSKTSANKSVNRAERNGDFWIFGGIFRPVYLEIVPERHIEHMAIDAKADGSFLVDIYPKDLSGDETIEAQIQKLNGENVGKPFSIKTDKAQDMVELKTTVANPLLWSSEFPNLYQVWVSIKNGKGIVHQVKQQFGFRTVELRKNDGFYVNGVKIMFRGCDRHSFWPETGRTLSHDLHVLDVNLMKEMNMNAVRMSHYPPDEDFIHVCDSLGLYVLDEVTGWHAAYDTIVGRKIVKEMVTRDVNHPAVVIWDNGNEGGWNVALDNDYALYDPQKRIVIHPWAKLNGTNTKHYPDYAYMLNSVATEQDVLFPTEFMHGLYDGGAGAALDDFWNLMLKHPHSAGGFIWAFLDEAVRRSDKNGAYDTDGNHAPDGIVGPHREKEGSFYAIKEIWSPIHIDAQPIDATFNGKLQVTNRYFFTNLKQCSFMWKVATLPSASAKSTDAKIVAGGIPPLFDVAPGATGILQLNLSPIWKKGDVLYLTAYGPDKKEVCTWSWPIKAPVVPKIAKTSSSNVTATETGTELSVNCGGIKYNFDEKTGYIQKVIKSTGDISLSGGPVLAGVNCDLKQFTHTSNNGQCIVDADYQGATGALHVKWTFASGQPAKLDYKYSQTGDADFIGITFNYPESKITGMKWEGRGPYRVWKNRLKGQQFGVWHKDYNDAITGETWGYPEFKGYHAEVNWVTIENKESPFTVYTDNKNMYFQMLHPSREKDALKNNNVEPAFPEGSLGFLSAIAPIGTKFQAAKVMGPASQKNTPSAQPVTGTLWFDFK
ncbi:glycoside hydrolase family 2 TIM barrel-domain containing protein [uncultured Mucilaginibacter sp.]|uniref:glycoside hydrolase family 2 protein n=1 Tax=uncultured Mucilaginibacter sp. TaxID=797541 RepID=UPI0025D9E44E|nr:glycoside hydrolase family 2 TIM barrel-domain containing protein [uncultured Mucilaginibacter sp.]